jgi:hypothetical protein
LVIGTALDIMTQVRSPRAVFVDHPVGRTFGSPGNRQRHEQVLAAALDSLPKFSQPGEIRDLHCQWDLNGDRTWEDELRTLLLGK